MTPTQALTLAEVDAAFEAEIVRVSHLEYDSNEICRHFYGKLRERLAALSAAPAAPVEPVAWQERQEIRAGVFGEWYDRRIPWGLDRPQEMESSGIRYQFRPLYAAPVPAEPAPEGWRLVPVEPTPEMVAAWPNNRHGSGHEAAIYRAMLAAAPAAPKE